MGDPSDALLIAPVGGQDLVVASDSPNQRGERGEERGESRDNLSVGKDQG